MKIKTKIIGGLFGLASLLMASQANAATVQINPDSITVVNGSTFTLTVEGIGFPATNGGGFSLIWDPTALMLNTTDTEVDTTLTNSGFNFNSVFIDQVAGTLDVINAAFFVPAVSGGNFDLAVLSFTALNPGVTTTDLGFFENQPTWVDENDVDLASQPRYIGATVTVSAVPVPAAVWLFGSGLIGLVGIARRRKTQFA